MEQTDEEFFHDFRQELLAGAEANGSFQLSEFMEAIANDLVETGFTEGFELCHFRAQRGMRVDGYWFNDEGVLDLFIADFDSRNELASLTRTEVAAAFKRVANFFEASANKGLAGELEVTVFQDAQGQGAAGVDSIIRLYNGEAVPSYIDIPYQLVTPENMADFK